MRPKYPFLIVAFSLLPIEAASRPNLLLVTIDTLRPDHLGCYGYKQIRTPNIDQLAEDGVRFRTVVSQVPLTLPSHCTILTGTYPAYHGVRDNVGYKLSESKTTLAKILRNQHYQTAAFVGAYVLNSKFGLNQGFDDYDDKIEGSSNFGPVVNLNQVERRAGEVVSRAMGWLKAHSQSPFFVWIHLYDPHDPYEPPSPFKEQYKANPYDGEIAYTDRELGRFLELLKQKRLYENTVVVLAGDHGESFGEHKEWTHGYFIYDPTILVPLIIKTIQKETAGKVVIEQVSLVDVAPTILQLLDLPRPTELQGLGMLGLMLGKQRDWQRQAYSETFYPAQFGWSPLMAVRRADAKFIKAPKSELYELRGDPGEHVNRILQRNALAHELNANLTQIESTYSDPNASQTASLSLSPQELEKLGALGYVGMSSHRNAGESLPSGAADPKDKLEVYQMISEGSREVAAGRYLQALPMLKRTIQIEPGMRMARSMLGHCYFALNQYEQAKDSFKEILKMQPKNSDAQFYVAACDYRLKDWTAAETGLNRVLMQDRNFAPAHLYLGFLYQAKGYPNPALAEFQRVLELDPENEDAHAKTGFLLASSGKVKEAVPHFQKVIQLNPQDGEAHFNLSVAYQKLNREELAHQELAAACKLDRKYCGREEKKVPSGK
ncbi:MAG TPA: sulfatase-like hydrolase/transferase [Terriglobia bacterium]|nr:sulfatase-like hydrolase/transferase [Terriglobia bacterium]